MLSCFLLGVFVGLVSFPTSLAILLQHLTMTGCLTEHECRAFCPEVLGFESFRTDLSEGVFIFRLVVLREHRTVCFAAAVAVSVACWCATMLLHKCCTMSLQNDHGGPCFTAYEVLSWGSYFSSCLFLSAYSEDPQSPVSFYGVHLNHCFFFLLYSKELICKEKRARRLKWILFDYHRIEGAAATLRRHEGISLSMMET